MLRSPPGWGWGAPGQLWWHSRGRGCFLQSLCNPKHRRCCSAEVPESFPWPTCSRQRCCGAGGTRPQGGSQTLLGSACTHSFVLTTLSTERGSLTLLFPFSGSYQCVISALLPASQRSERPAGLGGGPQPGQQDHGTSCCALAPAVPVSAGDVPVPVASPKRQGTAALACPALSARPLVNAGRTLPAPAVTACKSNARRSHDG